MENNNKKLHMGLILIAGGFVLSALSSTLSATLLFPDIPIQESVVVMVGSLISMICLVAPGGILIGIHVRKKRRLIGSIIIMFSTMYALISITYAIMEMVSATTV